MAVALFGSRYNASTCYYGASHVGLLSYSNVFCCEDILITWSFDADSTSFFNAAILEHCGTRVPHSWIKAVALSLYNAAIPLVANNCAEESAGDAGVIGIVARGMA